jgi:hypothetical protein
MEAAITAAQQDDLDDSILIPMTRLAADRLSYSGKNKKYRMNLQVIASAAGQILWVSGPLPTAATT